MTATTGEDMSATVAIVKQQFPEGTLVRLKCSPVTMQVEDNGRADGNVDVIWIAQDWTVHRDAFAPDALVKIDG